MRVGCASPRSSTTSSRTTCPSSTSRRRWPSTCGGRTPSRSTRPCASSRVRARRRSWSSGRSSTCCARATSPPPAPRRQPRRARRPRGAQPLRRPGRHDAGHRAPAPLPPGVELAAYRVVQEAVTNVVRHSGADRAEVAVEHGRGPSSSGSTTTARRGATWRRSTRGTASGGCASARHPSGATLRRRALAARWPARHGHLPDGGGPVIGVVLADDQALLRAGLQALLDAEDDIAVLGEAADGHEALDLVRSLRPDVVLMDIRMPGMDGSRPPGSSPPSPARGHPGRRPHDLRPRRVRLRGDPVRRERLPRQGHRADRAAPRGARGGRR